MDYRELRYNQVMFKAAHNAEELSRDKESPEQLIARLLSWDPDHPGENGCRGLEFDLCQRNDAWEWTVDHEDHRRGLPLRDYLHALAAWSDHNPDHDVITIHFDLKSDHVSLRDEQFPAEFDAYIGRVFEDSGQVYAPGKLIGDAGDLVGGAMANGWPKLSSLRNRFILVLTGEDGNGDRCAKRKDTYSKQHPRRRLCFVDRSLHGADDSRPSTTSGHRVFFNYHLYAKHHETWAKTFAWYHKQPSFVTRAWTLNNPHIWKLALAAGPNILATDIVGGNPPKEHFAFVGSAPFQMVANT